jgi:hypothetical protein
MYKLSGCIFAVVLIAYLFLKTAPDVFAVTLTISDFPASVSDGAFSVMASVSGATDATNYLRVDLYKDGTNNYFGETYNGSGWYGGGEGKSYFPVQIQNSSASATLQARLGSPSSNDYPGPGTYKLRIRRYTASGNSSTDDQTPIDVQITYSVPIPTPTQQPISTPVPTPTKTPSPAPASTKIPTPKPTISPAPEVTAEVLGEETFDPTSLPTAVPEEKIESKNQGKFPFFAVILILLGLAFIGVSCFMAFKHRLQ